jgi:hypothetical protein
MWHRDGSRTWPFRRNPQGRWVGNRVYTRRSVDGRPRRVRSGRDRQIRYRRSRSPNGTAAQGTVRRDPRHVQHVLRAPARSMIVNRPPTAVSLTKAEGRRGGDPAARGRLAPLEVVLHGRRSARRAAWPATWRCRSRAAGPRRRHRRDGSRRRCWRIPTSMTHDRALGTTGPLGPGSDARPGTGSITVRPGPAGVFRPGAAIIRTNAVVLARI